MGKWKKKVEWWNGEQWNGGTVEQWNGETVNQLDEHFKFSKIQTCLPASSPP